MAGRKLWKRLVAVAAAGFVGLAAATAGLAVLQLRGNLHAVAEGEVYRSNQPTPERLERLVQEVGLRSVLNLRGAQPGADWYRAERAAAEQLGLVLVDFPLSAQTALDDGQVAALVAAMRAAPKPLLIHCRSGADRTGLAAALYQMLVMGQDEEVAEWQLTPFYGHVPVPWLSQAWPMDETWERVEQRWGTDRG